jgi:zinc finger protein
MSQAFFPSIGSVAVKADELPDNSNETEQPDTDTDKPLHEIESLCMKCGEQVRLPRLT